ncbi:MAG: tryptophan--tRNA ligase [Peptoniphilus sp.]|nr:tryptophan--tRNA ligase [Peptoniphilus sp.]MDD7362539.1 tryptophan--tRNA ligase [Bacillota bacterium]MDY6045062.1 tryptophan--tRNA ligase [Peptoniphilus sp.]
MDKKVVFSAIQPSGSLTIGNYLGALSNFADLQKDYQCIYCVADMHAITVQQKPADLRRRTLDLIALYVACGIDPEESLLYIQSQVPEHAELTWVLNTITSIGQLNRMTQFKDKSKKQKEVYAGLLNYPVLMVSDILLYQTSYVPVGEDQRQHIELTRDIAERFNTRYSPTFTVPEIMAPKVGARIMSLQNPAVKMSKSDADENAFILILDEPDVIRRKIKRAVTDSVGEVHYSDEQPGVKNLLDIYSSFKKIDPDEAEREFASAGYGELKECVAEAVVEGLSPVQEKYKEIRGDKKELERICRHGAERAHYMASKTLKKVYRKVGFVQF